MFELYDLKFFNEKNSNIRLGNSEKRLPATTDGCHEH